MLSVIRDQFHENSIQFASQSTVGVFELSNIQTLLPVRNLRSGTTAFPS